MSLIVNKDEGKDMNSVKFRTKKGRYLYDVHTNHILNLSQLEWQLLTCHALELLNNKLDDHTNSSATNQLLWINSLRDEFGILPVDPPETEIRLLIDSQQLGHLLGEHLSSMTLCLTEECNFRCSYCCYGGSYASRRSHSSAFMSMEVARRAVDLLLKSSRHANELSLAFYGGEPVLAFDLIRDIISYIRSKTEKPIRLGFTTNGSLLSPRVIQYLDENNFATLISLDGPGQLHDRYRKSRGGTGTFDKIMQNIQCIKSTSVEYYDKHVGYAVTLAPPLDLDSLVDFFSDESIYTHAPLLFNFLNLSESTTFATESDARKMFHDYKLQRTELMKSLISLLDTNSLSAAQERRFSVLAQLFLNPHIALHHRELSPLTFCAANGACVPGHRRFFVACDGRLMACEKLEDKWIIGNVFDGFDMDAVSKLISSYVDMCYAANCTSCWARRVCTSCYLSMFSGNTISKELKQNRCANIKRAALKHMIEYCEMMEINPVFFKNTKVS